MKEIQVTRYQTDDGLIFRTYEEAMEHEAGKDVPVIEDKMASLNKRLSEIEIPLKEAAKTAPIEMHLTSGGDGRSIIPKLKEGHFRYFRLRNDDDAETLARYTLLARQLWYKKHDPGMLEREERLGTSPTEEDAAMYIKEYPCTAFISDQLHCYGEEIGTFLGEMERLEEYCANNGYTIKLTRKSE